MSAHSHPVFQEFREQCCFKIAESIQAWDTVEALRLLAAFETAVLIRVHQNACNFTDPINVCEWPDCTESIHHAICNCPECWKSDHYDCVIHGKGEGRDCPRR